MSHHRLSRPTALAVLGIIFGVSFAAVAAPPPSEPALLWPLYESGAASSGLAVTSTPRPGVLTTMGEYEAIYASSTPSPSPHPGIDVLGDVQDIAVFPAAGSIVYVSNPPHYTTPGRYCRIWVTSSEVATQ
ncbi:MAG: hypothetical protein JW751_27215, partial [Polyangiaceae bacterium]|nr:hypothetical protein [Polyangiaceae bacterium]